jgi:hypothetical protein
VLEIYQFDPEAKAYTGVSYKYRKDGEATNNGVVIGDMTNVGADKYVLIERDNWDIGGPLEGLEDNRPSRQHGDHHPSLQAAGG